MSLGIIPEIRNSAALRYFYEVAEHGSFRAASDAVHIATSAISRQIRLLEDDLGVALFDRGPGRDGVTLTAAGEVLQARLKQAMRELSTAHAEIQALRGLESGEVTLGFNDSIGRDFGVQLVQGFMAAHPGIAVNTVIGNTPGLTEQLLAGEIDILIAYSVPDRPDIRRGPTFETELHLMVPAGHDWAGRAAIPLADLADQVLILPEPTLALRRTFDKLMERNGIHPRRVMTSNSFETMADLVAAGLGHGIQVRPAPGRDPRRPGLHFVPIHDPRIERGTLALCMDARRVPSPAVRACFNQLADALPDLVQATPLP
ncbi:LysR family transcriptional regulator [Pseudooceanicola nanhaiensis]|uniref:LysR family transcriptional regulator n=1 Tax=Pseudooceanicola nanhaiensis TaxID=375761 RepID=UPI001CD421DF|nr:LysR family transcriptional regulator [Pseudooceanicola nanhaiensis]MCA0919965.1 LysR family transcriptional regulator [Pseudooceanicola nanhaiensis]